MSSSRILVPNPRVVDFDRQAIEAPFTRKPGQTGHYRAALHPELLTMDSPDLPWKTVPEILDDALARYPQNYRWLGRLPIVKPATLDTPVEYGTEYEWMTYAEGARRVKDIGSGIELLYEAGLLGKNDQGLETVGIWSKNCPEWQLIDQGLMSFSRVNVALYDTLGHDACEYVINHAAIQLVFVSEEHLQEVLALGRGKCPCLRIAICMDDHKPTTLASFETWAQEKGVKVMSLRQRECVLLVFSSAAYMVCSGTTWQRPPKRNSIPQAEGYCKHLVYFRYYRDAERSATCLAIIRSAQTVQGVVLTHENLVCCVYSWLIGAMPDLPPNAVYCSCLPLAHVYAHAMDQTVTALGLAVGYSTGNPLRLLEDCRILKPFAMTVVPRILNRLYGVMQPVVRAPGFSGDLLRHGLKVKLANLHSTGTVKHAVWDALVFRKIAALLGGNLRYIPLGAAPISGEVIDFVKVVLSAQVLQGYGMTESAGAATRSFEGDPLPGGFVGWPLPAMEIKLVSVPEMGYRAEDKPDPRGEVCIRGTCVTKQYYKDEELTRQTIDADGWLHTGDIGSFDFRGRLRIMDRIKNIVKLSQGEYVALEKVEAAYSTLPIVSQIFVHGEGKESYVVAVVIADRAALAALAGEVWGKGVAHTDEPALLQAAGDASVVGRVLEQMIAQASHERLKGFESVKRVVLALEPFTIENGLLASTLKIKRAAAVTRYRKEINALYALGEPAKSHKGQARL
ncbi:acetyl-CoA synthetase-like protein [Dacryopinax primogenitus]|uniref:Acetyl-CoA synthetase-like protein n=1 Tax=Dacryopinax primogenitus (strain DJM 731) TaxID=1858805 RepID=M5FXX8_DACPD|nr:acetyl-CoA synthetase-like protein [Dacryopinax primogenitus]EJT98401.1 acetyl-CoA synthetase-like protein [Dacryopinax primogenitus]